MQSVSSAEKKSLFFRFINGVEVVGNKLPHPFYLFCILCVIAVALSVIFSGASISYMSASSSGGGEKMVTATVRNLLNRETVTYVTENMYKIYYNFAPMMMVGLLMLAIGLADQVGFFSALIRRTILGARPSLVFAVVSFIAINAHIASNAGVLGCTTVAAAVFALLGYNPWLGIILAYAAGNAGMAASIFAGNLDVLISGINVSVCTSLGIDPSTVHVLEHWYFLIASLVLLTVAYTLITTKFVRGFIGEPKDLSLVLGKETEHELTPIERKGLRNAGIAAVIFFVVLIAACIPQNSFFRAPDGSIVPNSPLLKSVLTLLFLFFQITAMAYGRTVGKIAKWNDMPKMMSKSIGLVTSFMVIALPASLFIYLFNASNIPTGSRLQRPSAAHRRRAHDLLPRPLHDLRLVEVDDPRADTHPDVLRGRHQPRDDLARLPHRRLRDERRRADILRRRAHRRPPRRVPRTRRPAWAPSSPDACPTPSSR